MADKGNVPIDYERRGRGSHGSGFREKLATLSIEGDNAGVACDEVSVAWGMECSQEEFVLICREGVVWHDSF